MRSLILGVAIVAVLVVAPTGAYRSVPCTEAIVSTTAIGTTKGLIRRSSCPGWWPLPDRWTVTLERAGVSDEVFRSHGKPWPVRIEARGQGGQRRLMIHTEPRSLDGTGGLVEVPLGADGRPARGK